MNGTQKPGRRKSALEIETPEGVVFSYELATPFLRMLAWAVDAAAIAAASATGWAPISRSRAS